MTDSRHYPARPIVGVGAVMGPAKCATTSVPGRSVAASIVAMTVAAVILSATVEGALAPCPQAEDKADPT